jgi:hypothetical protein
MKICPNGQIRIRAKYPHDPRLPRVDRARTPTKGIPQQMTIISAWFCLILAGIDFNIFYGLPISKKLGTKNSTRRY